MIDLHGRRVRSYVTDISAGSNIRDGKVYLGSFNNKRSEIRNGVPWESWTEGNFRESEIFYIPDYFHGTRKVTVDELHGRPPYRTGGPFQSTLVRSEPPLKDGVLARGIYTNASNTRRWEGGFMPPSILDFHPESCTEITAFYNAVGPNSSYLPSMSIWGDRAWQRARPRLEYASGYVFGREADEVPGMLKTTKEALSVAPRTIRNLKDLSWQYHLNWRQLGGNQVSKIMGPKGLANQFLNIQFGWKPFIKDILDFHDVYQNSKRYLQKLTEENGKEVDRRVTLKAEVRQDKVLSGGGVYNSISYNVPCFPVNLPSDLFLSPPSWTLYDYEETHIGGKGVFVMYRPEFDDTRPEFHSAMNTVQRYLDVYGVRMSPSNLYKAYPWTWALDWVSNAGATVDRYSGMLADTMATKYFFVTQRKKRGRKMVITLPFHSGAVSLECFHFVETKQREEATNPYDFSLAWENLSPRQFAISAALGITRRR